MIPLVMTLDDPDADLATVGGKAASLSRLTRAGLPVPPGFVVTTAAYREFVAGRLDDRVQAAVSTVDPADRAATEAAAQRIAELVEHEGIPAEVDGAVRDAYARLGTDTTVAVRSSATAEDLPDLSFAGQQDTFLGLRGADEVVEAVRRCWASLWTARAIDYRARRNVAPADVALAVLVQVLVPAEASGVLFTADPVTGSHDRVVINAAWGLGETVVGGLVSPDTVEVDRSDGRVVREQIADKTVMAVPADHGTRTRDVPEARRRVAVLGQDEAAALGALGVRIEELGTGPVDVEWARAGGELFVLQARPVTARGTGTPVWNDSLGRDRLWTSGNLGEAIPDVMTPATWSLVELFMSGAMASASLPGYPGYGRIGGRFYMDLSMAASLARAVGIPVRRFVTLTEPTFGRLPPGETIPLVDVPRLDLLRRMVPVLLGVARRARSDRRRLGWFVHTHPAHCASLRERIQGTHDVAAHSRAWTDAVEPTFRRSCDMFAAATRLSGTTLIRVPQRLRRLVGDADAATLVTGDGDGRQLDSLGPMLGLAKLARGNIDRETFTRRWGHRGAHEFELSSPRPAESRHWVTDQLAAQSGATTNADDLLARRHEERRAAWGRLRARHPRRLRSVRRDLARWSAVAHAREETRSEVVRAIWVVRDWVVRAGELTGHGDDLFFLALPEILEVLAGSDAPLSAVPARRAAYERYRALPTYPTLIRGAFDPERWAADPDRRTDRYDARGAVEAAPSTVSGFPGAAGIVVGTARVLDAPEDGDRLLEGEVLVTTVTNIGWTPLFPRAAAVVTDVGAPLSHAAIVAREIGIPAVVGCGNATMRLTTGDAVRVDGTRGTVEILDARPGVDPG